MKEQDFLIKYLSEAKNIRAVLVVATQTIKTAQEKHGLNPLATYILGELILASLLKASDYKTGEKVQVRIESKNGLLHSAVAEATATGEVRGYISHKDIFPQAETKKSILAEILGEGFLHVRLFSRDDRKNQSSSVELVYKNIAQDFTHYYLQSEQIPTAIQLSIGFTEDLQIQAALGVMFQALPGAEEEELIAIEQGLIDHPSLWKNLKSGLSAEDIFSRIVHNIPFQEISRQTVKFHCTCQKERFLQFLKLLPQKDLWEMRNKPQTVVCHYCNTQYHFSPAEIEEIYLSSAKMNN